MRVLPASSAPLRWCLFLRQGAPEGKQGKPEGKSYFMSQIGSLEPAPLASVRPSLFSPTVIPQALKAGRDAGKAARAQGVALPVHTHSSCWVPACEVGGPSPLSCRRQDRGSGRFGSVVPPASPSSRHTLLRPSVTAGEELL
jgi:hypothetical protein